MQELRFWGAAGASAGCATSVPCCLSDSDDEMRYRPPPSMIAAAAPNHMDWFDDDDGGDGGGGGALDDELDWLPLFCFDDVEYSDRRLHCRRKISRDDASNEVTPPLDLFSICEHIIKSCYSLHSIVIHCIL